NYGSHADDDAQHGERGSHFVARQCAQSDSEDGGNFHIHPTSGYLLDAEGMRADYGSRRRIRINAVLKLHFRAQQLLERSVVGEASCWGTASGVAHDSGLIRAEGPLPGLAK